MKTYSEYGFNEFVILLGYKGYFIKEYFSNYFLHQSDVTIDLMSNKIEVHNSSSEPWKVTLLDTGLHSMIGGRIKRAHEFIGDEPFMLTYGDGVADIDIQEVLAFHQEHDKLMTMTSAQPEGRFGTLNINENDQVTTFEEKPKGDGSWINAGYFVCQPEVLDYIDDVVFEQEPLRKLAQDGEIFTYKHKGFWVPIDTLRDKTKLNEMCESGNTPWIIWDK
jgi:glucose-1-phosphate cytidylyltransferase